MWKDKHLLKQEYNLQQPYHEGDWKNYRVLFVFETSHETDTF